MQSFAVSALMMSWSIVNLMRKLCLKRVLVAGRFDRRDWQEADFLVTPKAHL